jgi:predicted glycoside hydrolase/deacetylase ChbG (UPF0249 family)
MDLSSELLGFPADARVLIVNADDLGMYHAVNTAVVDSIEQGIAVSCSVMPPCPWAPHAVRLLRERPEIPFGVHLTLVCDLDDYRWGPLSTKDRVRSLLDADGRFFGHAGIPELLAQARVDEVEVEARAQIEFVLEAGLAPTHLDWHCLADGGREDVLDLTLALAREYGLAARVWLDAGRAKARRMGLPVVDHDFLDSFSLGLEGKAARYVELLRALPPGLSEWAVHPGVGNDEAKAIDGGWRVRSTDYEFLMSPEARDVVADEGIAVIDYRTLQQAWASFPVV